MLRTAAKPKLSLNTAASISKPKLSLNTATVPTTPTLSLVTPTSPSYTFSHHVRSPRSPMAANSPTTTFNTSLNRRAAAAAASMSSSSAYLQVPTYNYTNSSEAKSILKKDSSKSSVPRKSCQINVQPTAVHAITPIDDADYWYKPVGRW